VVGDRVDERVASPPEVLQVAGAELQAAGSLTPAG
jgi:hypothetical protein